MVENGGNRWFSDIVEVLPDKQGNNRKEQDGLYR